jgi:hypothetical protein
MVASSIVEVCATRRSETMSHVIIAGGKIEENGQTSS